MQSSNGCSYSVILFHGSFSMYILCEPKNTKLLLFLRYLWLLLTGFNIFANQIRNDQRTYVV